MRDESTKRIAAVILGIAGVGLTAYIFKVHRDTGVYADETGTGGLTQTTSLEWGLTFLGFALVIISIVLLIKYSAEKK